MGKTYTEIPENLIEWIKRQQIFWIASAPLSPSGHINVSPKGIAGTFHIQSTTRVWYEDLTGSGAETIAHIRENGRVTILFSAFDGPPRIVRLYGRGSFYELGSPEYQALLPAGQRQPGSRAVIVVDIYEVGCTCGYSVPYYSFVGHRTPLLDWAARKEALDLKAATTAPGQSDEWRALLPPSPATISSRSSDLDGTAETPVVTHHRNGMLTWWKDRNSFSLDGLPALNFAHQQPASALAAHVPVRKAQFEPLNQYPPSNQPAGGKKLASKVVSIPQVLHTWIALVAHWIGILAVFKPHTTLASFWVPSIVYQTQKPSSLVSPSHSTSPTTRQAKASITLTPQPVCVHGEELIEYRLDAKEVQGPPVSWGVRRGLSTDLTPARTSPGALWAMISVSKMPSFGEGGVLLGCTVSFLFGMMFAVLMPSIMGKVIMRTYLQV